MKNYSYLYMIILFLTVLPFKTYSSTLTFEGQAIFTDHWTENSVNWTVQTVSDIRGYNAHNGSRHLYVQRSNDYLESDHFITVNSLYIYIDDIDNNNSYFDFIGYDNNNNVIKTQRFTPPEYAPDYIFVSLSGFTNITKLEFQFDGSGSGNVFPFIDDIDYTDNGALPVELVSFEGINTEEGVTLTWQTATEVNNYGFQVQRKKIKDNSEDEWETLGFVQGNGTTNSPKNYEFTDSLNLTLNPNLNRIDYRLKQIDNDGTFTYSKTITVDLSTITSVEDEEIPTVYSLSQNYPNPFNPTTTIKFSIPNVGTSRDLSLHTKLIVYDILGREVATLVNEKLQAGYYDVNFDGGNLASGMYIYRINIGDKFSSVKKMLMVK